MQGQAQYREPMVRGGQLTEVFKINIKIDAKTIEA